jgi:hypothetical protein
MSWIVRPRALECQGGSRFAAGRAAQGEGGDRAIGRLRGRVGEPTVPVVTPAVLDAVLAATSTPVPSLPLKNVELA